MVDKSNSFRSWFIEVREMYTAQNLGDLAETEDWHEWFDEGLTPSEAIERYLLQ